MLFSPSLLNAFNGCGLKGKFSYIDRLPQPQSAAATFGTVVHRAYEHLHKTEQLRGGQGDVEGAVDLFVDLWSNPDKAGLEPEYWPKNMNFGTLMDRGVDTIRAYASRRAWEKREIIGVEFGFSVPLGHHEVQGYVDLLELRGNARGGKVLAALDLKTAMRQPTKAELAAWIQGTAYILATEHPQFWEGTDKFPGHPDGLKAYERFKGIPRRAIWFAVVAGKEVDAGPRKQNDFDRLYRLMDSVAKAFEHNVFVPTLTAQECQYCSFTEQCGLPAPDPDDIDPDAL